MQRLIGIDTGGTYTDAVLFDPATGVLAKAKALTTREDLALGIGAALDAVLAEGGVGPAAIDMVSVSTTLATNAIVEGLGGRVGVVMIGFDPPDLDRAGLRAAAAQDALISIAGGHDSFGAEIAPLDRAALNAWLPDVAPTVEAFAVTGRFSVANPAHEEAVRTHIVALTGKPVTCSHDLTGQLNGPRRALTALLNARLVPIIHHLIEATAGLLARRGISAPLMIVKGDGSLLSLAEAQRRPVETILSGPAASLVGAGFLTGTPDALVSDIGGTTTDVGLLAGGRPRLNRDGASVAGLRTFVEAVAMHTFGLGGDSDVALPPGGSRLQLGPRRIMPVSLLAARYPDDVHPVLDRQLAGPAVSDLHGRFAVRTGRAPGATLASLAPAQRELFDRLAAGPLPLETVAAGFRQRAAFARLVTLGLAMPAGLTPSDAAHVLGLHRAWDIEAAGKAARLFARQRGPGGVPIAADGDGLAHLVLDTLVRDSADRILDVALEEDGFAEERPSAHPLIQAALDGHRGIAVLAAGLGRPLVALGASASVHYPAVGRRLGCSVEVPDHADVANAVGAVVGHVRCAVTVVVSRPDNGRFRLQGPEPPRDLLSEGEALAAAEALALRAVRERAAANGIADPAIGVETVKVAAEVAGHELVLEWRVTATADGRPVPLADAADGPDD